MLPWTRATSAKMTRNNVAIGAHEAWVARMLQTENEILCLYVNERIY